MSSLSMLVLLSFVLADGTFKKMKFVLDTERLVGIELKDRILIGHLDVNGNFYQKRMIDKTNSQNTISTNVEFFKLINFSRKSDAACLEFRSGTLILGKIKDHIFVPAIGSMVSDFKEYKHSIYSPNIWNLPGYFSYDSMKGFPKRK